MALELHACRRRPIAENPTIIEDLLMSVQSILPFLTIPFILGALFFGTRNGFYDTDKYHGNGSAH